MIVHFDPRACLMPDGATGTCGMEIVLSTPKPEQRAAFFLCTHDPPHALKVDSDTKEGVFLDVIPPDLLESLRQRINDINGRKVAGRAKTTH